jgi:predicted DNA-binding transcriptional regulator AlpA
MTETGYFRPAEARAIVGVSRSTLYRWKQQGLVRLYKIGGVAFFSLEEIQAFIANLGDGVEDTSETQNKKQASSKG